jgi:DNA-binding NarL/FixJ family response regulator/cell division protein FtsB
MPSTDQLTVLLADDDALRRDGLAAVLEGAPNVKVIARCQDGEEALEEIRHCAPRVAVVDINLPRLHGIELVRRVRAENLGTRIIVLSGTNDDEIVREVVRAGADGYLLKNGPARHLMDAISYVCDGGQYFSPQLGRDGRDRRLLEEPPRSPERYRESEPPDQHDRDKPRREDTSVRPTRHPKPMRERLREETAGDLNDRDYKIMSLMAEGLKPILDRLEEIDDRVAQMEDGDADLPEDPRGWLSAQLADTFRGGRADSRALARNPRDIEARLPQMIEQAVTDRFEQMAGKLQQEIEETHVKTLETFVKNVQVKLVQRVSSLEQDMARHTQAMHQLRDSSQRTEDNLSRLITGVDKLAQELPKRIAAATAAQAGQSQGQSAADSTEPRRERPHRRRSTSRGVLLIWGGIAGLLVIAVILYFGIRTPTEPQVAAGGRSASPAAQAPVVKLPPGADTPTKMRTAQEYADRKEYPAAEEIYKQVIQTEPDNTEALKALASVLYREDKLAESAAVLDKIR